MSLSKPMYWVLWAIALISINVFVIPLAFFTSSEEETGFITEMLLMLLVLLLCNLATIQLFLAAMKENQQGFSQGLIAAGFFVLSMFFIWQGIAVRFAVLVLVASIVAAAILFVLELYSMMRGNRNV